MSSTNRGAVRDKDDYYATPPQVADLICQHIKKDFFGAQDPTTVLEPGCGAGSFLAAARKWFPNSVVEGIEYNEALAEKSRSKGFTVRYENLLTADIPNYQLVVGNPPFKHAAEFIRRLAPRLDEDRGTLALLLRLNFFGSQDRWENLWPLHIPHHVYVLPYRVGFTPDGKTDSIEYMVACWGRESAARTTMSFIDNSKIENRWRRGAYEDPRKNWFPDDMPEDE